MPKHPVAAAHPRSSGAGPLLGSTVQATASGEWFWVVLDPRNLHKGNAVELGVAPRQELAVAAMESVCSRRKRQLHLLPGSIARAFVEVCAKRAGGIR